MLEEDIYKTIEEQGEAIYTEKRSKFLAFAIPVTTLDEVKEWIEVYQKKYYDARHVCYAYRLGERGDQERSNDNGEPSGTAGKPILGQIHSKELTNVLVIVVRYFGGTKLGVPGLIAAYKESAAAVLDEAIIEERTVDKRIKIDFSYIVMNDVMRIIKEEQPKIEEQVFDNLCSMTLAMRLSKADILLGRLKKVEGAIVEVLE